MPSRRFYTHSITLLISSVLTCSAGAQLCTQGPIGLPSGPRDEQAIIASMIPHAELDGTSLIVGGRFVLPPYSSGSPNTSVTSVAKYYKGRWTPMDTGLTPGFVMSSFITLDLSPNGGPGPSLYGACGGVYRWDGASWTPPATDQISPFSLVAFEDASGPVLLAATNHPNGVFAWRGSGSWTPYASLDISSGFIRQLRSLDVDGAPTLFAIGTHTDPSRNLSHLIKLVEGQWQQVPLWSGGHITTLSDAIFFDDGVHGPELHVAGLFQLPGQPLASVARFRSGVWELVPSVDGLFPNGFNPTFITVERNAEQHVYVSVSGAAGILGLAQLTSNGLESPGIGFTRQSVAGGVSSILAHDDGDGEQLYIAGAFSRFHTDLSVPINYDTATPAPAIVRSNEGTYESLASGLGDVRPGAALDTVYQLSTLRYQDRDLLLAGGPFARAGGRYAHGAALFDGTTWTPLSFPPSSMPSAAQSAAVVPIQGVERIVAHTIQGSTDAIRYWDGVQWSPLPGQQFSGTRILKLLALNNQLYCLTTNGLHRYTTTNWQQITSLFLPSGAIVGDIGNGPHIFIPRSGTGVVQFDGVNLAPVGNPIGAPHALAIHDDGSGPTLYACISGTPSFLHRLTGSTWVPVPGTPGISTQRCSLASFNDGAGPALYLTGEFTSVNGQSTPGLAKWQHGQWHAFDATAPSILDTKARSLAVFNNRLYLAGNFTHLGDTQADHLAYFEFCPPPCSSDFNRDGDHGTDADIEAFFACLAGTCCPSCQSADFNHDGQPATEADIESFFRVLGGGPC